MNKNKLIIVSGGMDSITLLHEFKNEIALAVSFIYGQKHLKEIAFATQNCMELKINHTTVDIQHAILENLKSNLLRTGADIPNGHYEDQVMKQTVVPFRNGIMLSLAAGIAESNNLKYVLVANHAGDHAIYPDCREEFIWAMNLAMNKGTYNEIQLLAPYTNITKRDIALRGHLLEVDYSKTWSCYKGKEMHCGECGTCVERKEALQGFDPTEYEND